MKIGTIILSVLILIGCAAYTANREHANKTEEYNDIQRSKVEIEMATRENRKEEALRIDMAAGSGRIPNSMPAPVAAPKSSVSNKIPNSTLTHEIIITKPDKPTIVENINIVSSQLFKATLAFALKDKANIDEAIKAQLLLSTIEEDVNKLASQLTATGPKTIANIEVSKIIKANIIAPNFKITYVTPEEQILAEKKSTEWEWILQPLTAGNHEVKLVVTAVIKVGNRETTHSLEKFNKVLTIEITKKQILENWWDENYKWVIGTLLLPLLGFLFKDKLKEKFKKF